MIVVKSAKLHTLILYVGRPLATLFAFDVLVVVGYVFWGWRWLALPEIPLSIFGSVIGAFVIFRNNNSYSRWWEARTIWGSIVNNSRSFGRQALSMITAPEASDVEKSELSEFKRKLVLHQVAYVNSLRDHLRGLPPWDGLAALLPEQELAALKSQQNVPLAIQREMASLLRNCYERGWIGDIRWTSLDATLSSLMDSQGASERIKNTPLPRQYDLFLQLFVNFYSLLLPLGMVERLGLLTPIGSTLVGFIFLALDQIGRSLETPFENNPDDVPISAISRTIEINLRQMLCESEIPQPLAPVNGVLW
jgi:putative membrane protein